MFVKGLLTAAVVSTPLCFVVHQDPQPARPGTGRAATTQDDARAVQRELDATRRELDRAQRHIDKLERQLEQALDALDATFEPQRDRNCSPSRSRALMSHYQWLRKNDLPQRAAKTLALVVERAGDDRGQLNSTAWHLMTDEETVGQYDEVALALAERMQQGAQPDALDPGYLDTIALARFLNGQVDRAIALQQQAIARGGNGDDFRRRLRTYQAAQLALAKAHGDGDVLRGAAVAAVASSDDE
jgi:hypothetical protein